MIREYLAQMHWSALPVVSMFLFLAVFLGALFWVFRKGSTEVYAEIGKLPLEPQGEDR